MPQALFEAGGRAPGSLRPAFAAAQREWLLTTDFERTVAVLQARLADRLRTPPARRCWSRTRSAAATSTGGWRS